MEQRAMPSQVHGESGLLDPCRFGRRKKRKPFTVSSLHLHYVRHDVHGTRVGGLQVERSTRHAFGASIVTVLLEAESVHGKNARIAGCGRLPCGQHPSDPIAQHLPAAKSKVECMRDDKRDDVARAVGDDGAIAIERERGIALKPGARRRRVATRRMVRVRTGRLDDRYAGGKRGSCGNIVSKHNERGAQTMAEQALRVVGKHPLDLRSGISAVFEHERERVIASTHQIAIGLDAHGA